ncbi:MAG: DUF3667 domain-containing protein [Hyphomonadaceae bacterium]
MSGELEAAGALATAGIVGGAIEGRGSGEAGEGLCLNCGVKVEGRFCSNCGQATHPHRKLTHVLDELVHGILHFDTKAWRTLPMVIFRPGTLTRNYVYGKRARYISPIALFLFTIFFMFFVFAFAQPATDINLDEAPQTRAEAVRDLEEAREGLRETEGALAEIRAEAARGDDVGVAETVTAQAVEASRAEVRRREQALERVEARERAIVQIGVGDDPSRARQAPAVESAPTETPAEAAPPAAAETPAMEEESGPSTWQDAMREIAESENFVVIDGMPELNERIRHKFENPDLALYKIQQTAYKFSFLLAPLSLPFIAFLFLWKRGVTLYDHVVYALYALSFASLLFVAVVMSAQHPWTRWLPAWLILVGLPIHTYFHLKGSYALGWWSALWRSFFMLIFANIILVLFIVAIVVLGLAG